MDYSIKVLLTSIFTIMISIVFFSINPKEYRESYIALFFVAAFISSIILFIVTVYIIIWKF